MALDAMKPITFLAAGVRLTYLGVTSRLITLYQDTCWLSASEDAEVRQYSKASPEFEGLVSNAIGVAIRCLAIDPQSKRVAVTSE